MQAINNIIHSKTVMGFTILLITIVGLALTNHLTDQAVEAIKWLGASFMTVRAVANHAEGKSDGNSSQ